MDFEDVPECLSNFLRALPKTRKRKAEKTIGQDFLKYLSFYSNTNLNIIIY